MKNDKKLNEVIRIHKKQNGFVMIDREFLENENLSWKAKGILAYLLSKPDNWKVIVKDIVNHSTDGKAAVYNGLNELKGCGYYEKKPIRDDRGTFVRWESTVYECPTKSPEKVLSSPFTVFPEMDNPKMGNPDMGKRERSDKDINNTLSFNNNQPSQVTHDRHDGDGTDNTSQKIKAYCELIKENIGYTDFITARPHDIKLVDEFINIIIDTVMTTGKTVRIDGEDKPRVLVTSRLMKLTYDDTEFVIDRFKRVTVPISKKKQYILTMLYNAKMELDAHYTNRVKSDMRQ